MRLSISILKSCGLPYRHTNVQPLLIVSFFLIFPPARFGFRNIGKDTLVDDIISTEKQQSIVTKLHEILRPFLLRRLKKDVLIKMPPKREFIIYCGLSSVQQEYYAMIGADTLRDDLARMGIENANTISQKNKEMNYRKVCNHPFLFGEPKGPDGVYMGTARL